MALIRCPDCQKDVSDAAPACPGCGRPVADQGAATRQNPQVRTLKVTGALLLFGCVPACVAGSAQPSGTFMFPAAIFACVLGFVLFIAGRMLE